jgi:hypothetical protein
VERSWHRAVLLQREVEGSRAGSDRRDAGLKMDWVEVEEERRGRVREGEGF